MTLIAGFRCQGGGILLCADREEDDGYNKREIDKILRIPLLSDCDVFIAGAGPTGPIKRVYYDIGESLNAADEGRKGIWKDHRKLIEGPLEKLYKNYPENMTESPIGLLVVVASRDAERVPVLYRSDGFMLIPEPFYAAYGSGKPIADYLADRMFFDHTRLDKPSLAILAAFIMREAQRTASGVGLGADLVFIHEGDKSMQFIPPDSVKELERGIPPLSDSIYEHWKVHATAPEWVSNRIKRKEL